MVHLGIGRFNSKEGDYFLYRQSSRLASKVLVIVSSAVSLSCVGLIIALCVELHDRSKNKNGEDSDQVVHDEYLLALLIYTVVILIASATDFIFAVLLQIGIRQLKLSYCLFWRGAAVTSLLVCGLLTLSFITMVQNLTPMLGYLPSLISKPFALWMVNGFISELAELRVFPYNTVANGDLICQHPPAKPNFSLDDLEQIKRSTTVFNMSPGSGSKSGRKSGRYSLRPCLITSKLKSIPEDK